MEPQQQSQSQPIQTQPALQPQTDPQKPTVQPKSWQLFKRSFATLKGDKEMVLFPLVGALASILAAFGFFTLFYLISPDTFNETSSGESENPLVYAVLFTYYVIQYFIISYFNAGLASAVLQRYSGQDPTFRTGIQHANRHVGQIFGYAVIAATIGVLLQLIADKLKLGWLVSLIIDTAWAVATVFVIPVLVTTDKGPIAGIKESVRILRATWGSNVIGWFGFGLVTLMGLLISFGLLMIAAFFGTIFTENPATSLLIGIVLLALGSLITILIVSTCTTIFRASLYHFATTRQLPPGFEDSGLEHAVKVKK